MLHMLMLTIRPEKRRYGSGVSASLSFYLDYLELKSAEYIQGKLIENYILVNFSARLKITMNF